MEGTRNFFAKSDFRFDPFNRGQSVLLAIVEIVGLLSILVMIYEVAMNGVKQIVDTAVIASIAMLSISFVMVILSVLQFQKGRQFMRASAKNLADSEGVRKMAEFATMEMELNQRSFELQVASQRHKPQTVQDSFTTTGMKEKINSLDPEYSQGYHAEWEQVDINKGQAIALVEKYVNMYAMGQAIPSDIFANWSKAANMPNQELRLFCKDMNECTQGRRKLEPLQRRLAKIRKKWDEKGT